MKSAVLVGIGAGSYAGMTDDAKMAIEAAGVVVGAPRVLESVEELIHGESFYEYAPERILELFDSYIKVAEKSGSAVLGAPLTNDFAVISLSNLLTPLSLIEKRLRAAASGDFCIALYNPRSHGRPDALKNACSVLLEQVKPDTVCGWVRNIARSGEEFHFCTLKELMSAELDMFCTAFVGNSLTRLVEHGGRTYMVTPRGYGLKTELGR